MNIVAQRILGILIDRFKEKGAANFNLNQELNRIDPVTDREMTDEEKDFVRKELQKAIQYKESHDSAILIPVSVVSDPREHVDWYDGWLAENNDSNNSYYWKSLENFLSNELTKKYGAIDAGKIVKSIDFATYSIMNKLANPARKEFNYKGLVVGYVQSGKTANFTALIAKAADAGYKLIIVLAGIHNILRRQTQVRLDRELTGEIDFENPDNYIDRPVPAKVWNRLTTAHNDFSIANKGLFSNYCQSVNPSIAITKKNVRILNRLIDYVSQASEELRANMPILIIDDEADQASIDGNANNPDTDPTATNECIRRLLSHFNRKAYVGYTATPFANVLINMSTDDDLYPRNFIISLPEPEGYFGTSKIFQGGLSKHIVKRTTDTEGILMQNGITDNLSNSVDLFIIGCAIRNKRGDKNKPMSMLVHVSRLTLVHERLNEIISDYVSTVKKRYNNKKHNSILKEQFKKEWENYYLDIQAINPKNLIHSFDEIWDEIENVFKVIKVLELNASSDDKLDYTTGEETKVIAIGGNQLSRGLTLEGLMISYYLRASNQYDTLLQMGRWFGYRHGYEDLTRIFTTTQIWQYFSHLATVEEELRRDIKRYDNSDNTPADLTLTIRTHSRLAVTASNKLGAAMLRQTSYSDSLNQTFKFPLDISEKLRANLNIATSFIRLATEQCQFKESWVKGVWLSEKTFSSDFIIKSFYDKYNFEERFNGTGFRKRSIKTIYY